MLKIKNVKPMANRVITTMNKYDIDVKNGQLIDVTKLKGTVKDFQTVVAVGPMVHNINVGDTVLINPSAYGKPKQVRDQGNGSVAQMSEGYHVEMEYNFPTIVLNGVDHLFITDRDIDCVCEIEECDDPSPIIEAPAIQIYN